MTEEREELYLVEISVLMQQLSLHRRLLDIATRSSCCHRDPATKESCAKDGHCADIALVERLRQGTP